MDTTRMASGAVRAARGGLLIGEERVPLEDVAVLLLGESVTISGAALALLAKFDVILLNCDWRGVPNLVGYGWRETSRVAARHRAQAELSLPRRKAAWQAIVKAKIRGQQHNLELAAEFRVAEKVRELAKSVRSGDTSNCEAQAARWYWSVIFDDPKFHRIPGADGDLNGLLNYGYTVLRGFVIQAIAAAGLWPTYGVWHRNRSNTFALADDLIEPFRPAVDHQVRLLGSGVTLEERAAKRALVGVVSQPMGRGGATVASAISELASGLGRYCEGDREKLSVPVWMPIGE